MRTILSVCVSDSTDTKGLAQSAPGDAALASEVRTTVARLHRRLRQKRPAHGLGLTDLSVLSRLHRVGPASPKELAEQEKIQPQSLTRVLSTLEDRRLIMRRRHPVDGRQAVIAITADGQQLVEADRQQRDQWLAEAIEQRLSPIERDVLVLAAQVLNRLSE
jgi:DNA-binding MarR family transcriptional regulator